MKRRKRKRSFIEKAKRLRLLIILAVVGMAMALVSWGMWLNWDLGGLLLNLATELIGAIVTYLLLERIVGEREQKEEERKRLIAEMGSRVKDVAVAAEERLRKHGWLTDGTLSGVYLHDADLRGANLQWADLSQAQLSMAHLHEANLHDANLRGANLWWADLTGADLSGADLTGADLSGANLRGAKVTNEQLRQADSLKGATMPDGTIHD